MGLRRKYPDLHRPYKAPYGVIGCYVTILIYTFMLFYADKIALYTAGLLSVMCAVFWYFYTNHKEQKMLSLEEEIGEVAEPTAEEKAKMDREYAIWKWGTIIVTIVALGIYLIPMFC